MSNVIEKMEQELLYLESLTPDERSAWAGIQTFKYDAIWDDIFEFDCDNAPLGGKFIVLCESYNIQISMVSHQVNTIPNIGRGVPIKAAPYECIFDALAEAA